MQPLAPLEKKVTWDRLEFLATSAKLEQQVD
jgi:hypothetical protein